MLSKELVTRNLRVSRGSIGRLKFIHRRESPDPFCKKYNIGLFYPKTFLFGKDFENMNTIIKDVLQHVAGIIAGSVINLILSKLWQTLKSGFEYWRLRRKKAEVPRRYVRAICILLIRRGIAIVVIVILVM